MHRRRPGSLWLCTCVPLLAAAACGSSSTGNPSGGGETSGTGSSTNSGSTSGSSGSGAGETTSGAGNSGAESGSPVSSQSGNTSNSGSAETPQDASTAPDEAGPNSEMIVEDGGPLVIDSGFNTIPETDAGGGDGAATACVKGQTKPDEVIMLGDSYMDYGGVGPAIMAAAGNVMYRHYYLAGSAINYGSGALNIPYQYETEAMTDTKVAMPKDIKVVIMDGGGNDVLIDNRECLTTAPLTTMCTNAIDGTLARGQKLMQEMAQNGVQHIVYYFYPHLDTKGGGLLPSPPPGVDLSLDYALPKMEQICCGSSFTTTDTTYSCRGTMGGSDCIVVDTNPIFAGHNMEGGSSYWLKTGDNVHPNSDGAAAIAKVVWQAMVNYCVAQ